MSAEPLAERLEIVSDAREMRGPSALGGGWRRFLALSWMIASTEFRLSYFGSVLGPVWALFRPLMLFGVLYVVFSQIVKFGDDIKDYPMVLLFDIMFFGFFTDATSNAVTSVVQNENLVRKMHFPRMVIPVAVVLTQAMHLAVNLIAVFLLLLVYGIDPQLGWLALPLLVLPMVVVASGVAMLLSSLYVRWRDVQPIWAVASTALFYGSPVLYTLDQAPEEVRSEMGYNPLAAILTQARKWIIDPDAPSASAALGGWEHLLIPSLIAAALLVLGFWVFNREAPRIAELL